MTAQHEIPTHLSVEDRAFYGLTARQVMYLTVGLSASYGLWTQWPSVPTPLRLALAALCAGLALTLALVRPDGRSLDEWAFVALRYLLAPRRSVWRPAEPDLQGWMASEPDWEDLAPQLTWREGQL